MTRHNDDDFATPVAIASERGMGYREITNALIADIRAGRWQLGDQLPTEADLVDRFGASRNTVRESLRELDVYGFIRRRRGTRSILVARDPVSFVNSVRSIEELLQYSRRTVSQLLTVERIIAGAPLAERLGVAEGSEWLRIEVLRAARRDQVPIGFSEIFVDARFADIAEHLTAGETVYDLLERRHGLVFRRVEQTIEAVAASANIASRLAVAIDSPLLCVRTDFVAGNGEIAEIGFGHFPAGRYKMEIMLERGAPERVDE